MKCCHIGEYKKAPEAEMEVRACQHSYYCPVCGFVWECPVKGCGSPEKTLSEIELQKLLER